MNIDARKSLLRMSAAAAAIAAGMALDCTAKGRCCIVLGLGKENEGTEGGRAH